jgi:hypothetical protein
MIEAGDIVYVRHFQRGRVGGLFPMRAVAHRDDGLLLHGAYRQPFWHFNMPDGRTLAQTPLPEWSAVDHVPVPARTGHALLAWHPTGADYSIRWFFDPTDRFYAWYANLEFPGAPWRDDDIAGLDTIDWDLDVWIEPDRTWRWKDEELFAERLTVPDAYWVDDAERVRRAGREVIALAEAGAFPFDGTWCDFTPDPGWSPPPDTLPARWDRPPAWRLTGPATA